jgi:hypothetical protein
MTRLSQLGIDTIFSLMISRARWALLALILILCALNEALSQAESTAQTKCPLVSVSCVGKNHCTESPFYFVAKVTEADPKIKFSYHWAVHTGTIVEGQGTSTIKVSGENGVVAMVKLKGLPAACKYDSATIALIWDPPPPVRQIAELRSISFQQVKPHLDKLAYQLRNSPGSQGSIVSTRKWASVTNALHYLLSKHGIPPERILLVDQKRKGPLWIKLYIVPSGAVLPDK